MQYRGLFNFVSVFLIGTSVLFSSCSSLGGVANSVSETLKAQNIDEIKSDVKIEIDGPAASKFSIRNASLVADKGKTKVCGVTITLAPTGALVGSETLAFELGKTTISNATTVFTSFLAREGNHDESWDIDVAKAVIITKNTPEYKITFFPYALAKQSFSLTRSSGVARLVTESQGKELSDAFYHGEMNGKTFIVTIFLSGLDGRATQGILTFTLPEEKSVTKADETDAAAKIN